MDDTCLAYQESCSLTSLQPAQVNTSEIHFFYSGDNESRTSGLNKVVEAEQEVTRRRGRRLAPLVTEEVNSQ